MHFAESYKKAQAPGKRVFNVWVEGSLAFENLDVFSEAKGGYNPLTKKHTVEVKDGDLTIEFGRVIQNPTIKGIEIHSFIQLATAPEFSTMLPRSHLPDLESFKPIYINAGGSNYTDKDGNLWVADSVTKYYNTGFALEKNDSAISGTDDQVLYQSERWDVFNGPSMTYNIPVPAGGVYGKYATNLELEPWYHGIIDYFFCRPISSFRRNLFKGSTAKKESLRRHSRGRVDFGELRYLPGGRRLYCSHKGSTRSRCVGWNVDD